MYIVEVGIMGLNIWRQKEFCSDLFKVSILLCNNRRVFDTSFILSILSYNWYEAERKWTDWASRICRVRLPLICLSWVSSLAWTLNPVSPLYRISHKVQVIRSHSGVWCPRVLHPAVREEAAGQVGAGEEAGSGVPLFSTTLMLNPILSPSDFIAS